MADFDSEMSALAADLTLRHDCTSVKNQILPPHKAATFGFYQKHSENASVFFNLLKSIYRCFFENRISHKPASFRTI